jgi:ubiquinone/menaquinone biosynthesis C-methylase UbiE
MLSKLYYGLHRLLSRTEERGEYSAGVWQNMIRAEALKLSAGSGGKLLEVGCGEGLFLAQAAAANAGWELWGVDNSAVRIAQAQKRLAGKNAHCAVEDATKLSFSDRFFDRAVCINVLFNMPGIDVVRKTLLEMKRVVKDDGRLVFDFRNANNPLLALKYGLAPLYDRTVKDMPLKTYRLSQINELLDAIGLQIVSLHYPGSSGHIWSPIIVVEAKKK